MLLWALLPSATGENRARTWEKQSCRDRRGRQTGVPLAVRPAKLQQGGSDQEDLLTVIVQMHSLFGG